MAEWATHDEVAWAREYDGYLRLAKTPEELGRLIGPARNSYLVRGQVPDWCGVDLLKGWAFFLASVDHHVGGDSLRAEWRDVLAAVRKRPDVYAGDNPPASKAAPAAINLPTNFSTEPKMHGDPGFLAAKQARLWEPHIAPINEFVHQIGKQVGAPVPYVDPDSGGIRSRVLFLLESPGPKAVTSGMISVDNNDETAKNMWVAYRDSGLPRNQGLHWNAVPWQVGEGAKVKAPGLADVKAGRGYLLELLDLMPAVRVVVPMGNKAQAAVSGLVGDLTQRGVLVIDSPHPSPIPTAVTKGRNLEVVLNAYVAARAISRAD
ncbi:uracil-DNA glycosylase [Georgenia alba]|uniref:Uracil-DNA glycosylase n=1 Tax=Georgenia alba TaxID=2233858 RepID=A0ABW2Q919_9MICO